MATVAERVAAGAALLDEKRPDWFKSIDSAMLDIASPRQCVCGQLYTSFYNGIRDLGIDGSKSTDYGFAVGDANVNEINDAWRAVIASRVAVPERELVLA